MRLYAASWVAPVDGPPLADGAVAFEGAQLIAVGPAAEVRERFPDAPEEAFPGCVIAPGFVNLHTHVEYSAYAGFGDGLPFGPWIADHIARKRRLLPEDPLALARLGVAACLRSGATTIVDASFSGAAAVAASEAGIRAVVALEAFGGSDADPVAVADGLDARLLELAPAAGPLVELAVSPHAPYTVAPAVFAELVARARDAGRRVVTHVAESAHEIAALRDGSGPLAEAARRARSEVAPFGRHPVAELVARGLLGPETVVAHAVEVGAEEVALLAASGCAVAHCPRSNALLGCGAAPLSALRAAGVRVGLGTDSPASALTLDVFDELRSAIMVARTRERDAGALSATEALRLATLGGAEALGLADRLGSLTPGKQADLVVVDVAGTPFHPSDDPVAALVLGGAPERVARTVVAGVVRYRDDERAYDAALACAAEARARMLSPAS